MAIQQPEIRLPPPKKKGDVSLEEAIAKRRSVRRYAAEPVPLSSLSQIMWAAQGITDSDMQLRAVPSAGVLFPLEIYVLVGIDGVEGLQEGVYHYNVDRHSLECLKLGDLKAELARAALRQQFVYRAALDIVICAVYERTAWRYGRRAERYVHIEVGHVGQNICLQAMALGLGAVPIGAFDDEQVVGILGTREEVRPLYIIPIGKPA